MKFRTELRPVAVPAPITHQQKLFAMGSCFAGHIATKLKKHKFKVSLNPFGIIYNPISIANNLKRLLAKEPFRQDELIYHQEKWISLSHHGQYALKKPDEALLHINNDFRKGQNDLDNANILILTLGTGYIYEYGPERKIVANCHKLPASAFQKRLLTVAEIVEVLSTFFENFLARKPGRKIIMSVSPVRHLRDGMIENQRSKATLHLATAQLQQTFEQVYYFPAYELLMDDLRDYRFYNPDLLHPSDMAIDYIWEFFSHTWFDETGRKLNQQIEKILKAAQHRPLNPQSKSHLQFVHTQIELIRDLQKQYPELNFEEEIKLLQSAI